MKLYIKHMVSLRCKMSVEKELKKLKLGHATVSLGMVEIIEDITKEKRMLFKNGLFKSGLELLDDKKSILIEKIVSSIVEMIHDIEEAPKTNYSTYLSEKLGYNYTYLANIFSEIKGITLQHYIINHKIELVKELLFYKEFNLTEIAHKLHYSSTAHLSNQFKKVTGFSPTYYKKLKMKRERNLEDL
ncbi:AraC family transcriptional regulator [uncultured Kordia sp.]|uniref:helix-turn-helix domain-containing protein n=1 Tax=uncultured Kordia sp. TaxID=507699 RepID=UPI0026334295|nr:AraC family transcriptional regulator [uncultured Kordia sp.]